IRRALGRRLPRWHIPMSVLAALGRAGDMIGHVSRRRFLFDSDALVKLVGSAWYSSERIARELGYRPTLTFEEALPDMITWYREAKA
ncbi:MAG: hypothetical protein ACREVW_04370, partial [Burkholderiales bacterium]